MEDLKEIKYKEISKMPSEDTVRHHLQDKNYEPFILQQMCAILWFRGLKKGSPPGSSLQLVRWPKDDVVNLLKKIDTFELINEEVLGVGRKLEDFDMKEIDGFVIEESEYPRLNEKIKREPE